MKLARTMMVGAHRIGNACLTLQFDKNLDKFEQTYIITAFDPVRLDRTFQRYNIDTSTFVYITDQEMLAKYPAMSSWNLTGDYRGTWLFQQALKLASIDLTGAEIVFIQDADAFCVTPYQCETNNQLNLLYIPNTSHAPGYYEAFRNITGLPRQTPHCFVCDMMPVRKTDWIDLRTSIEQRTGQHFLNAIIENTPWDYVAGVKWFSEYELLGNWLVSHYDHYQLIEQHRYEYKNLEHLTHRDLPAKVDCISDKNPYGGILPFDYASDTVLNLDVAMERMKNLGFL